MRKTVLLVEDDPALQALTAAILKNHYSIFQALTVTEAHYILASHPIDLVLLDLSLPDEDGLVLARQIRARSSLPPIIFVTSFNSPNHKIEALNLGGDDYVTKPFDPDELIARINAVLRRTIGEDAPPIPKRIRVGSIAIDLESRQIWDSQNNPVALTRAEFSILIAIINANGRILNRDTLLDAISTSPYHEAGHRTIDALVSKIRRKIGDAGHKNKLIVTVQGVGYRLGAIRS